MMGVSRLGVVGGWSKALRLKLARRVSCGDVELLRKRSAESREDGHQNQSKGPSGTESREFRCSDAATQHAARSTQRGG